MSLYIYVYITVSLPHPIKIPSFNISQCCWSIFAF